MIRNKNALFIGLGVMGYSMAGHLSKCTPTFIFNRTEKTAEKWLTNFSGQRLSKLDVIPPDIDIIITCIGNDEDLKEIYLSDSGLITNCNPGTLFIDHTTASATIAREIYAKARSKQQGFIDAPVSGGEQGAKNGQLTAMCGGDISDYERAKDLISSYSKAVTDMGKSGSGQLTKMVNQVAIAGLLQGLAESIHLAEQAGLNTMQVIDVISKGAAQSWQMENRGKTMIKGEYNHGFAVDLMRKDLDICLTEARKLGATLPVTALVDQFYSDVQKIGGNRWDTSSLLVRLHPKK